MRKIRNLCIAIIALVGLSSSAFAQSGQAPFIGGTHTYSVTYHTDNTYVWSVTTDFQGNNDASSLVTMASTTGITTGNSMDITWDNPAIGTTYFVHVVETNLDGCSNHKVLAVNPVNGFILALTSVSDSDVLLDGTAGKELDQCAPSASVIAYDGTDFTYGYGENIFYYKITASGIGSNGWSPQFTLGTTDAAASYVATWGTTLAGTGNTVDNLDGTINDINVVGGNASIWIKVVVTNAEGIAANPIVVTLLDGADTSEDANGNDVTSITGSAATQTVKARPNTSGITAN